MSCTNTGPFDGGTWNNAVIVNPEITGGTIANSTLTNISITGAVNLDDTAAVSILDAICGNINDCVEVKPEEVAAVFKTCAGQAHVPDAQIPTCEEMNQAIAEATAVVITADVPASSVAAADDNVLPTTIVGTDRSQLLGKPATYLKLGNYLVPAYTAE